MQLSFDDIMKYSSAYGEGNSALEALEVHVHVHICHVWLGGPTPPCSARIDSIMLNVTKNSASG